MHTIHYIVESLALDQRELLNMYHEGNSIHERDAFEMRLTEDMIRADFTTLTTEGIQQFLKNLIGFSWKASFFTAVS
jgi:ribonucleoside-diphosphate reductase beta chain